MGSASGAKIEPTSRRTNGNKPRLRLSNSSHSLHHRQYSGLRLQLRRPRRTAVNNGGRSRNRGAQSTASRISKRQQGSSLHCKPLLQGKLQAH
jgi:hypothetical protein